MKMLFDAFVSIGRGIGLEDHQAADIHSLRRMLDKYGIAKALVTSFAGRELAVDYGNELVFRAAAQDARLIPCPVVLPDSGNEVGDEREYIDQLIVRGARCVCLYTAKCQTGTDSRVIGNLLKALEDRRLPLALFETSLPDAANLATEYPGLPFIIHAPGTRNRELIPCLKQAKNLYISIAPRFSAFRGLEHLARDVGVDRMLFASGFPISEPGATIAYLAYSGLSNADVDMIAHGNLLRLMEGIRMPETTLKSGRALMMPSSSAQKRLLKKRVGGVCRHVWQRKPCPWKGMMDMHSHFGHWIEFPIWCDSPDDLVAEMDRVGVAKAMVSHQACMTPDVVWGNNQVLAAMKRFPERIMGYALCYPVNKQLGIREIRRCIARGMRGIKMHTSNSIAYTAEGYKPVWEFADERRLPVLLHTWGDLPNHEPVFQRYKRAQILLGHSGVLNPGMYVGYARKYSNLFLEITYSAAPFGLVEYFVREVGADRILFGADSPWMTHSHQIGRILFADITDRQKKTILIENPKRILKATL